MKMKWNKILVLALVFCIAQVSYGQKSSNESGKLVTIKGKVINKENKPVSGAVLYVDNLATSSVTKNDGSYKIKVSPSAQTIEVRSESFGIEKMPINGQTTINFTLSGTLADAVSPTDKKDQPGIKSEPAKSGKTRVHKPVNYANIYQMIRAEVPGVTVSGSTVQIHQGHSFIGSSTPLFVLNGAIVNSIDNINPLEVKSIKVLTGTQASIYGLQGSNGVLSITLKNGSEREKEQ
jgi:hypothetical protein